MADDRQRSQTVEKASFYSGSVRSLGSEVGWAERSSCPHQLWPSQSLHLAQDRLFTLLRNPVAPPAQTQGGNHFYEKALFSFFLLSFASPSSFLPPCLSLSFLVSFYYKHNSWSLKTLMILEASIRIKKEELPGGPAKTPCSQCRGTGIRSLVRELDSTCCT